MNKNLFIADLHIHGRYSRGCSSELTIANLEKYARIKGINLLGTGDFTHPKWFSELKQSLEQDTTANNQGLLKTKHGFNFVLQTEISLIYSQNGKGRRIHNIVLAPDFAVAEQITEELKKRGRVDYDGRPIFKIPCPEFVEIMNGIDKNIEVIPAHIWTPWFSLFGSNSGFDSIKECFQDKLNKISAIETGLSSDPAMNWRLSQLDKLQILSFSDLHSFWPWRIGREATVFEIADSYGELIKAIRTGKGLKETIEVDPNYGKYHFDGHRNCNVCLSPKESISHNKICPVCKKPLTIGVASRVEELADRSEGYRPENAKPFSYLMPLHELISKVISKGIATKAVWGIYNKLLESFGSELDVLLRAEKKHLRAVAGENLTAAIWLNRQNKIKVKPGYDGVYGEPILEENNMGDNDYKDNEYKADGSYSCINNEKLNKEKAGSIQKYSQIPNKEAIKRMQKSLFDF